jgi:hypothetical protein
MKIEIVIVVKIRVDEYINNFKEWIFYLISTLVVRAYSNEFLILFQALLVVVQCFYIVLIYAAYKSSIQSKIQKKIDFLILDIMDQHQEFLSKTFDSQVDLDLAITNYC